MKNISYESLKKYNKPLLKIHNSTDMTINKLLDREAIINSDVLISLCNDLHNILLIDEIDMVIESIYKLEDSLFHLSERNEHNNIPSLDSFYSKLSPILLRAIIERDNLDESNSLTKTLLEAIRIGIEDELHSLQEKVSNS
jgi:hypothetical protein